MTVVKQPVIETVIIGNTDSFRRTNLIGNISMANDVNWDKTSLYLSFYDEPNSKKVNYKILNVSKDVLNEAINISSKKHNINVNLIF